MRRTIAASVVGLLAVGALSSWVWTTRFDENRPMDFSLLAKHMENFSPKYQPADCLVRVDMAHSAEWNENISNRVFRNLMRHISEETPQMGMAQWIVDPKHGNIFIQFSDNCPERYSVMRDWARHYARRYDNPRFTVSDDIIKPGPETLEVKGFPWLD